ncbi:Uncharacterised protein [Mycoplasmopsis caviae]|uniref:Uncharacterized protein n=1 Tax=Mycoplasmopsis caviae TaxID=55603 RepID=A0A3P8KD57_9BACT|nr:Uncharacterised protein [Mycoplasmopsis caviae]
MNNNFDYIQLYLRNIYNMVQRDQRSIETYKQYKKYLTVFKKWEDINELISLMNKELQNRQISNNSKLTKRNIFKAFLSWYTKWIIFIWIITVNLYIFVRKKVDVKLYQRRC